MCNFVAPLSHQIFGDAEKCVYLHIDISIFMKMGALIKDFLSNKLRPVLKQRGYVKKGNSFLRQSGDMIYIINIQGSSLFSWDGNETFYVNVGIVSTKVENAVGHVCSIKETSPSTLLFSQVNLRADVLIPLESDSYTISETENADQCLYDIIQVDEKLNQIKNTEDLYPLLCKSFTSKYAWESTFMKYWAMNGGRDKFDKILEENAQLCKEKGMETLPMKEWARSLGINILPFTNER